MPSLDEQPQKANVATTPHCFLRGTKFFKLRLLHGKPPSGIRMHCGEEIEVTCDRIKNARVHDEAKKTFRDDLWRFVRLLCNSRKEWWPKLWTQT